MKHIPNHGLGPQTSGCPCNSSGGCGNNTINSAPNGYTTTGLGPQTSGCPCDSCGNTVKTAVRLVPFTNTQKAQLMSANTNSLLSVRPQYHMKPSPFPGVL